MVERAGRRLAAGRGVRRRRGGGRPGHARRGRRASWPSPSCATRRARSSCSPREADRGLRGLLQAHPGGLGRGRGARWCGPSGASCRCKVAEWVLLAEARRTFGDKWHGVTDVETRYRQREVDLWANERAGSCCACAATWSAACASDCGPRVSWRWRRRCCTRSPAGPRPARS